MVFLSFLYRQICKKYHIFLYLLLTLTTFCLLGFMSDKAWQLQSNMTWWGILLKSPLIMENFPSVSIFSNPLMKSSFHLNPPTSTLVLPYLSWYYSILSELLLWLMWMFVLLCLPLLSLIHTINNRYNNRIIMATIT